MSQFTFQNMLTELTQSSEPVRASRPTGRSKKSESDANSTSCKTPRNTKTPNTPSSRKCLGSIQTPNHTPHSSMSKTPKKTPKTPSRDRFIPNRETTDIDRANYVIKKQDDDSENNAADAANKSRLTEALNNGQNPSDARILHFREKVPETQDHTNNLKVLYSASHPAVSKSASTRHIRQQPERILDAPYLMDDYYVNQIDWTNSNYLIVALGSSLYLWNGETGSITMLTQLEDENDYVSSVKAMPQGPIIAFGSSSGFVQLWDISQQKLLRTMTGHSERIGSLAWNSYILSSGARSGFIHHHDVRAPEHHVGTITAHRQEVCGLAWSLDGRHIASGGNDNLLNIWDATLGEVTTPIHSLTQHQAAVKAIAFCPWNTQILASGGGTADRHIRLWNTSTGQCISSVDTKSQVCAILWSEHHKELISGHGYAQHQLSIWKYPGMTKVTDLTGHTARVLCLAMSPDGTTVVSAAADETLRLWKCFEKLPSKTAKTKTSSTSGSFGLSTHSSIR